MKIGNLQTWVTNRGGTWKVIGLPISWDSEITPIYRLIWVGKVGDQSYGSMACFTVPTLFASVQFMASLAIIYIVDIMMVRLKPNLLFNWSMQPERCLGRIGQGIAWNALGNWQTNRSWESKPHPLQRLPRGYYPLMILLPNRPHKA